MAQPRMLSLHRETLTELTSDDLRAVAGAALPTRYNCEIPSLDGCFTGNPSLAGC